MSTLFPVHFLCALSAFLAVVHAQSIVNPTTAAPSATALAAAFGYTYIGCWNETVGYKSNDGARALAGGKESANNTMTTTSCLEYCSTGYNGQIMQYAGLEYGRECWCGPYLSVLSEKVSETRCIYSCDGNASEVCGGQDALTLYNLTASDSKTGIAWSRFSGAAGYGTLAIITLAIAVVL